MADTRTRHVGDERGYLIVALLVAMSVMAILMTAALPAWRTWAQREKEAELIFRGEQYARAIERYQRKYANAAPPSFDVLVNEKFLRKKYKDPITNDEFQPVRFGAPLPGSPTPGPQGTQQTGLPQGQGQGQGPTGGAGLFPPGRQTSAGPSPGATPPGGQGVGGGGIVGVVSKSAEKSFRLYNGRDTYNQWVFMGVQQNIQGGTGGIGGRAGGRGANDGRGGRGGDGRGGNDGRGGFGGPNTPPPFGGRGGFGGPDTQSPFGGRAPQPPPGRGRGN